MDLLIGALLGLGAFLIGILGNLVASEFYDRAPTLAHRLVELAVRQLSEEDRPRYREEWLAHINECPGKIGMLLHAAGCVLGASSIARQRALALAGSQQNSRSNHRREGRLLNLIKTRMFLATSLLILLVASVLLYAFVSGRVYHLYSDEALIRMINNAAAREVSEGRVTHASLNSPEQQPLPINPMIIRISAERGSKKTEAFLKFLSESEQKN